MPIYRRSLMGRVKNGSRLLTCGYSCIFAGCHLHRKVVELPVSHETHNPKVGGSNHPPQPPRGSSVPTGSHSLPLVMRQLHHHKSQRAIRFAPPHGLRHAFRPTSLAYICTKNSACIFAYWIAAKRCTAHHLSQSSSFFTVYAGPNECFCETRGWKSISRRFRIALDHRFSNPSASFCASS